MPIEELKEKLHSIIEETNNEVLLEDLLLVSLFAAFLLSIAAYDTAIHI
jgi:hypothetical protein